MDIQGYIIDHWLGKMSAEKPVLVIYDRNALYHSVLPLAEEKGVKVIDTKPRAYCMPGWLRLVFGVVNWQRIMICV